MKKIEVIGNKTKLICENELKYIQFDCFEEYSDSLLHCMSTRHGGISRGECYSLNLGFNRNDEQSNISENFKIICKAVGFGYESLVFSSQVHDNRIRIVNEHDIGKGYKRESIDNGFDGLVTNAKGVTIVTFYADCVPVLIYEKDKNVAALIHSGWRSTLKNIASEAVDTMKREFGCNCENMVAAIGPSINKCCFEVNQDVYDQFLSVNDAKEFYSSNENGKWNINLQGIIEKALIKCGLIKGNITNSNICTKCRKDLFFSYRGDGGKTGSLAAFMQLK